jgi:hypothetical protein
MDAETRADIILKQPFIYSYRFLTHPIIPSLASNRGEDLDMYYKQCLRITQLGFPLSNLLERDSGGEGIIMLLFLLLLSQLDKQILF